MTHYNTIIGFDYGRKRIGVAVGQTLTNTARPLTVISVKAKKPAWVAIDSLIQIWQPHKIIVGLSTYADGSNNQLTIATQHFCQQLQHRYQLPVHTIDETLSTKTAVDRMRSLTKKRTIKKVDAVAAQVILETWLATFTLTSSNSTLVSL